MPETSRPDIKIHSLQNNAFIKLLRCPLSGESLHLKNAKLISDSGHYSYPITPSGIPVFTDQVCSKEGKVQQQHYDQYAAQYLENLTYPHTQEYMNYLDQALLDTLKEAKLDTVVEICCGWGEAFGLLKGRIIHGIGIDVSLQMLETANNEHKNENLLFVQGDATMLPLADESFDAAIMLGGIHHVPDYKLLFSEIYRILKPGGHVFWREPVNDFLPWRLIRKVVYRISPALDSETERPLRYSEMLPILEESGLMLRYWQTYGFIGFCIFMNSDVLVFNRLFNYVPGIRGITRAFVRLDDWIVRLPGFTHYGLQVVGVAEKL